MSQYGYSQGGQIKIYARIVRSCLSLPEDQLRVLLFVLDRTVERGKSIDVIPLKEFEIGVIRKKAGKRVRVVRGTGLAPERLNLAIDALCNAGAITVSRRGSNICCSINDDWLHPELPQKGQFALWNVNEADYIYSSCEDGG